ncbi:MAG: DUF885 family protein, partial [Verrucomicrobia bacterium]|nr:DUF885 family protein [Verrucomicrobiota bacterium]
MNAFNRLLGLVLLVSAAVAASDGVAQAPGARPDAALPVNGEFDDFVRLYQADAHSVSRFYDLPWSQTRFDRMEQFDKEWQQRLSAAPFDPLNQQGRIDYLLLRNRIEGELNELALERRGLAEMNELLTFRLPIQKLEQSRWHLEPVDAPASAGVVSALLDQIREIRQRVEKGKKEEKPKKSESPGKVSAKQTEPGAKQLDLTPLTVSPILAKRVAAATDEVRATFKNWYSFYDGYQPEFSWWLKKPYEEAEKALEGYAKFLREEVAGMKDKEADPLLGEPIGAEMLAKDLAVEMIPYRAEELIAIGEKEFAWCETEMKKAAKEMGLGEDWRAALAKVKKDYVPPGQQQDLVAACGREAIQFVKDRNLVTVPPLCEETWRLSMISPEGQKTIPYAAYGGQNVMVAYAKDEMKHEDKLMAMRGNNRHFMRPVVAHELIPGHHLQAFVGGRHRSYRAMFGTPFLVEGWALYWEMMLWEQGYPRTPQERIGMLFWRMNRCARIIVSLKFHLGQMKPLEMVDYLVDRVGLEKYGATSEVRRFIGNGYSPLYQCGYMIGGLQLRALRRELVGT